MSESVFTIITAAGDSQGLFLSAGFGCPKSLVKWHGQEVIVRATKSYALNYANTIVALNANECAAWPIQGQLLSVLPDVEAISVSSEARGALATAVLASAKVPDEAPLVIAAGDSEICGGIAANVHRFIQEGADGGVIAFRSNDVRWSYVAVNRSGRVARVAEKAVISDLATTGVFFFRTVRLFLEAAEWCFVNNAQLGGNYYTSSALNYLVFQSMNVMYDEIDSERYRSFSLPADFRDGVTL